MKKPMNVRRLTSLGGLAMLLAAILCPPASQAAQSWNPGASPTAIPVRLHLDKESVVTVVIEDAAGNRVRNLIAETRLPAGDTTIFWDGYEEGRRDDQGNLVRRRVAAGSYRVRGLAHDGIRMIYEMTVDNPGLPPWTTKDGSGGWLADHSTPADILYLAKGVPAPNGKGAAQFLVASTSAEAGSEFVWLDAQGRRLFGTNDGFWGGTHLAVDLGSAAVSDFAAYIFESGQRDSDNFTIEVRGIRSSSGQLESVVRFPRPRSLPTFKGIEAYASDGLAVRDGRIVCAVTGLNKLILADARSKKVTGEIELPSPRAPVFDRDGSLVLISAGKVKRFRLSFAPPRLEEERTLIEQDLEDPRRLAADAAGNLYISDWGMSNQVKMFDLAGHAIRRYGVPGGLQLGSYDERRMARPAGVAVDPAGNVWVAEGEFPKRISVWDREGALVRAFYGPEKYGGGGAIDPRDSTRFYYEEAGAGIEFALDWASGTSKPRSLYWRPDLTPLLERMPGPAPERAIYVGGHQYLTNCYNGTLRYNNDRGVGIWRMDPDGVARPVAMIGNGADLVNHIWGWPMKHREAIAKLWTGKKAEDVLFVWSDRNGDGIAQPDEIDWVALDHSSLPGHEIGGAGLEPLVLEDLSFTTAYGIHVPAPGIDSRGIPAYALSRRKEIGDPSALRSPLLSGDRALFHEDADGSWAGTDLGGKKRWRYLATPENQIGGPGAMVQPTRLLGPAVTPPAGEAGPLVAVNGEMGAIFLLTMDGLFIQTLGGDARLLPPLSESNPRPGKLMEGFTFQQEHFHPTLNARADGAVVLVAGFQQGTLFRLEGWQSVKRKDFGPLQVEPQDLASLPATWIRPAHREGSATGTLSLRPRGPLVDGDLSDWPADTPWLRIDERASAALAADRERLYLAFRTGDPRALENEGRDGRYLFKSGGALDLMLRTEPGGRDRHTVGVGDLRLLVTLREGKPAAILYRQVSSGGPTPLKVEFSSPVGKVIFDEVRDVSDQLILAFRGGDFECSLPLRVLGFSPSKDAELLGDVGILRGREGRTMQRTYWSNADTTLVSDLPSEARLEPARWGVLKVR